MGARRCSERGLHDCMLCVMRRQWGGLVPVEETLRAQGPARLPLCPALCCAVLRLGSTLAALPGLKERWLTDLLWRRTATTHPLPAPPS